MQNLLEDLKKLLKKDKRFTVEDELLKNKVVESALKLDRELIRLLLSHQSLKDHFFKKVENTLIFEKDKFVKFVSNKQFLPDSYTSFKNKIGLTEGDEYICEKKDIVLSWPYKDCVLEGQQTKEDVKRDEIFWNQILAPDEIDRLLDPKVFINAKRVNKDGKHSFDKFNRRKNGVISDNLIVKGNNLLALHSLEKEFAGKVKLIYIDPPYNTGSDSFGYNDKFNHSTWLTFMKNRLEIARELLKDDGAIFISINHIELGYLSNLMDELYGANNKLPLVTLQVGTTASYRSINECPVNVSEYLIGYSKTSKFNTNTVYVESSYSEDYSHYITNIDQNPKEWKLISLDEIVYGKHNVENWREYKKKMGEAWKEIRFQEKQEIALKEPERVVSLNTLQKPSSKIKAIIKKSRGNRGKIYIYERKKYNDVYCYNGRTLAFFKSKFKKISGKKVPAEILTNIWNDISFLGIGPEGDVSLSNGKKPEKLVKRLLDLVLEPGKTEIVLDFFIGTGTSMAVAHKMQQQYIGIEQLNYGKNDSTIRLKNVIDGDSSGISKSVNWQSGGDYVYLELAKWNQEFAEKVKDTKSKKKLEKIWEEMQKRAFLSWRLDFGKLEENAKEFEDLSLENQKKFLLKVLDHNQLYINYSAIEDEMYGVSEDDKKLNKEFYENS